MTVTTRYFGVTGAGLMDGTTFADRAPLFSAGNWSSIITSFNFTTDSLQCWLKPGTYSCSQCFDASIMTSTMPSNGTSGGGLYLFACDSSGDAWVPPHWSPAQPATAWESDLPLINHTLTIRACINLAGVYVRGLKIVSNANAINRAAFQNYGSLEWCIAEMTGVNGGLFAIGCPGRTVKNCVARCTSGSYQSAFEFNSSSPPIMDNCRAEGAGIGTGFRASSIGNYTIANCVAYNFATAFSAVGSGSRWNMTRCTAKAVTTGISTTSTRNADGLIARNFIVAGTTGITLNAIHNCGVYDNRIRATTAKSFATDQVEYGNLTVSGTDADEFVDSANGDLRIKSTSAYWGLGIGASDEVGSSSSSQARGTQHGLFMGNRGVI